MSNLIANRYAVQDVIGRGAMGTVYRAQDTQSGELVAVKELKPDLIQRNPEMVERFTREGEALRRLNHPNIVKVLATPGAGMQRYIVMELVPGGTLADLLREDRVLPLSRVLTVALELTDALTRAHHLKIIHRDIKPSNVLLAEDGTPRLTDFGVAHFSGSKLTNDGVTVGTFDYLSPEACMGEALDVRADIWAFGIILYEMLAGRHPFEEESRTPAVISAILTRPVPPIDRLRPDLPDALVDLIHRMLEKKREARIPRMRMVGAELEGIIEGLDTDMRPVAVEYGFAGSSITSTPLTPQGASGSTLHIAPPDNLPAFVTRFVGREHEISELSALLDDPGNRLITLLGPGGIGKTRLAVAAARHQIDRMLNGVFYVPLAPVSDPAFIVSTIAEQLDFTFGGADDPQTQLLNFLREKNLLLVLDNIEHLLEGADVIAEILRAAPRVKVLGISRARLRLHGEVAYDLQGMLLPAETSPAGLAQYAAVQLFMESAQRLVPAFDLDEETAPAVARIIHLVGGMPLGIELAAGWLEMMPVEEVATEIANSLDFLETDLRDMPERHRSLRAVFESTWNLMTDDERDALMKLSVFRGGFTREAAQTVSGASLRSLTALVNKSLLRRAADGRYTPHIMLRQYAEEQFATSMEVQAVRAAHAEYYANLIRKFFADFNTPRELKATEQIEIELENMRQAWRFSVENAAWQNLEKMLHPLYLYHTVRSQLQESIMALSALTQALEAAGQAESELYWQVQSRHGSMAGRLGDYRTIFDLCERAASFFRRTGNTVELSLALNGLSYGAMWLGQLEDSIRYARESADVSRDDPLAKEFYMFAIGNLGYAQYLKGDLVAAQGTYMEFNSLAREENSPISLGFGLNNLGEIRQASGETAEAQQLYEESHAIFQRYRHRRGEAFTLTNLGSLLFLMGDFDEARRNYLKSYNLYRDIGDRAGLANSAHALADVALQTGILDDARRRYTESLQIRREIGDQRAAALVLEGLAQVASQQGDESEAQRLQAEADDIRQALALA